MDGWMDHFVGEGNICIVGGRGGGADHDDDDEGGSSSSSGGGGGGSVPGGGSCVYSGKFICGELPVGRRIFPDGSIYVGEFSSSSGAMEGEGTFECSSSKLSYTGFWKDNELIEGSCVDEDGFPMAIKSAAWKKYTHSTNNNNDTTTSTTAAPQQQQ
eukprot:TRINITY_DN67605_c4_g2_i1.p2 TRINITY_DN67605_c4_g2~~TRINITY_DN67605_c4_g2_i1.p2  ORF type:complete len:157 (+),score=52.05 TRINITY_DN67605_c4_g2_i1:669-1139(+)